MSTDYDSPWKEALDAYFEPFLALLFPEVHRQIDWSRGYESLDKEFQQVVREAEVGRRYVDKLVKVWTTDGAECWVLIHVEVQTTRDAEFPRRMYVYNYRVFDRYNRPVASLAVLADDDPTGGRRTSAAACSAARRHPFSGGEVAGLAAHEAVLEASVNPFAHGAGAPEGTADARRSRRPACLEGPPGAQPVRARLQPEGCARTVSPHRLADGTAAGVGGCVLARGGQNSRGETYAIRHEY